MNSVVGIGSIYTKKSNPTQGGGLIFAGIPAKVVKDGINWSRAHTWDYNPNAFIENMNKELNKNTL